jgi:hypothetical protein
MMVDQSKIAVPVAGYRMETFTACAAVPPLSHCSTGALMPRAKTVSVYG